MKIKHILIPATAIALSLSSPAFAKRDKDDDHPGRINTNRQSYEDSLRGQDRAEERRELKRLRKDYKKHKKGKHRDKDDYDDDKKKHRRDHDKKKFKSRDDDYKKRRRDRDDDYDHRYYQIEESQHPIDTGINEGADRAKQKIDDIHRRAIEAIDNQTDRAVNQRPSRNEPPPEQQPGSKKWWWPF